MSEPRADLLYDALHAFEARRHRAPVYPVHKRLAAEGHDGSDIYDWIVDRLEPHPVAHALDAGCGVGYGAIRLARRLDCRVTGITVSSRELVTARNNARHEGLSPEVAFALGSFDELPPNTYDLVVAVESLKHSATLEVSLRSLLASLRPAGQLVIVDDFYDGRERGRIERALASDWELVRLYSERDFLKALGDTLPRCVVDLSDRVQHGTRWTLAVKSLALAVIRPFASTEHRRALQAFRGGLRLEALYSRHAMAYKALFYTKEIEG